MAEPLRSVVIDTDEPEPMEQTAGIVIPLSDGSVTIDLSPQSDDDEDTGFDANLALKMEAAKLSGIAESLLEGIDADLSSRREWESTRAKGIDLLGLPLEEPRGDIGSSSAPLEGMSTVRHPLLLEANLRFWANACGELYPSAGPVKIRNDGDESSANDELAEAFEKDFNHFLTVTDKAYYPDSKRMIFWTGFGGSGFKKVYHSPMKRRPISESVDANDLIVSNSAADTSDATRVTHRILMRPSVMKRMQLLGVYRDVPLGQPQPAQNVVDIKEEQVEGIRSNQDRPEDQPYTLYECYCEVDIDEYAPSKFKNKGIPLPYRVTIDKDSREILEVRRNWKEDDEECEQKKVFVKFPFVDALGFYGMGLVHILGNSTNALTAAWREMLDAGMFANFPGFAYLKQVGKQLTNEFRVPPGGGVGIDSPTQDIRTALMPLPYKDVLPGLSQLVQNINEQSKSVGGTADLPVGEGKQDAPVGTTIALIEQATKIESAVHKGLHTAQSEEFQMLKELFKEDPESFWRHNKTPSAQWNEELLLKALDDCNLVPMADPNTPSHMHRVTKALAIKQLQAQNPPLYDAKAVDTRILKMIKVDDIEGLFAQQQGAPPPDPIAMAKVIDAQARQMVAQTNMQKVQNESQDAGAKLAEAQAQRQSDEDVATLHLASEMVIHGDEREQAQRDHALELMKHAHEAGMGIQTQLFNQGQAFQSANLDQQKHQQDVQQTAREHALGVAQAHHSAGLEQQQHALAVGQAQHDAI